MRKHFLLFFLLGCFVALKAQISIKDSSATIPMVSASFGLQLPKGNLADRFGSNASLGFSFFIKNKNNWMYGVDWNYMFGRNIKESGILDSIKTENGQIIAPSGEYAEVIIYERGFHSSVYFGRLFPVLGPNPNSGIFYLVGLGLLQHKIRIEDTGNQTPQLAPEYRKGYDRLTNGFAINQFAGYSFLGNNKLVNFYAGIEFVHAWTQSRRSYDYDLMRRDTQKRKDMLIGIRAGWILPLYKRTPREFYYY